MIILNFFQINGEAEKILKEFSIPKKGRLVSFLWFQTINGVAEVLFLMLSREFSRAIILEFFWVKCADEMSQWHFLFSYRFFFSSDILSIFFCLLLCSFSIIILYGATMLCSCFSPTRAGLFKVWLSYPRVSENFDFSFVTFVEVFTWYGLPACSFKLQ